MVAFDSEALKKELQKNQGSKFLLLGDEALSRKEAFDIPVSYTHLTLPTID
jgi:hypothetical protein